MTADDLATPYRGGFIGQQHHFALQVYFEDTDAAGIVYYANYLRFMERARSDMLQAIGIDQSAALASGEGVYAVAEAHIRYHRPARLGDSLALHSRLVGVSAATATIHQQVMRKEEMLASARIVAAYITPGGRPRRQPAAWLALFKPLIVKEAP